MRSKRCDPEKLVVQFCPTAQAEAFARQAAWKLLKDRARAAAKKVNTRGRIPPEICRDVGWLSQAVNAINADMAVLIDEDLQKLTRPGARREELVGKIFTHILVMRAANTLFWGIEGGAKEDALT